MIFGLFIKVSSVKPSLVLVYVWVHHFVHVTDMYSVPLTQQMHILLVESGIAALNCYSAAE